MIVSIIAARLVSKPHGRLFGQQPDSNLLAKVIRSLFGRKSVENRIAWSKTVSRCVGIFQQGRSDWAGTSIGFRPV